MNDPARKARRMKKEIVVPVMVECTFGKQPITINLANVTYVRAGSVSGIDNPQRKPSSGVYFTNGDSHVIDQSPAEFAELSARAREAAGV